MAILINDTTPRVQYTATSGQTVFSVPFEFFSNADLKVYKNATLQTVTTHYTVTGAGVTGGGSVTLTSGATAGDIITILRDIPVARSSDFPTSGPFNIDALNSDLDRLTAMVQERETAIERSLRMPDTDGTISTTLPAKASRQGRVLAFNATTGAPEAGPTITAVNDVSASSANVDTVAGAISNVNTVAGSIANVNTASGNISNINTVAGISANVTSVAGNSTNINSVASNAADVSTVASNIASVNSAASNIVAIQNAATNASNAATSATAAANSATSAAGSAASAANAQTAAESARDQTLAAFDSFDDRYLGSKTADPTLDNDGNALVGGALYFNASTGVMMVYTGSAWVAAYASLSGALLVANNLSDLASAATARANLGLGTAATQASSAFAAASHTHTATDISDSTTAGRALLTGVDAAAQRTSLGLGSLATKSTIASSDITDGTIVPADLSTGAPSWTSGGVLSFNSGYGSDAAAFGVRAWVHFDAASGTPSIVTSGNVSAVADLGVGSYRVDFDVDLPDGDFAISATSSQTINRPSAPLAASVTLQTGYASSTGGAVANVDANNVTVMVVR